MTFWMRALRILVETHLPLVFRSAKTLILLVCFAVVFRSLLAFALTGDSLKQDNPVMPTTLSVTDSQSEKSSDIGSLVEELKAMALFGASEHTAKSQAVQTGAPNLEVLLARYEIRGVIWGSEPTILMFDTEAKATSAVVEGDKIGGITVAEIAVDRVTFKLFEESLDVSF